jgi:hypothetical protein
MNLEQKANKHTDLQYPMGVEREYPIEDFKAGYNECKTDLIEFLKVNYKASVKDILKHLEELK